MKEKILVFARDLFNKKGIQSTTLRDIAKEMNISDGHLRYYFKTKESLILAIFTEMDQTIAAFADENTSTGNEATNIINPITNSFKVMYQYAFFFTESQAILELFPEVNRAYQNLIENRKAMFLKVFEQFKEQEIFTRSVDAALFPVLFEQFFILSDNWIKYAKMPDKINLSDQERINHYVVVCLGLFLPYFNEQLKKKIIIWVKKVY